MSIWRHFFGQDPKQLFLDFNPKDSKWSVVTWNFDLKNPKERQWIIETVGPVHKVIQWSKNSKEDVKFFINHHLVRQRRISEHHKELKDLMTLSVHSTIKSGLEANHDFMVTPVSGATALDIQNETRALQWIQTTFMMLTKALDGLALDSRLILTSAFFSGIEPSTGERVLRVITFNLDIFYYLKSDFSLHIAVFDDKNLGHGESKAPTFQQIIKVTKPQFYDEITKLVHRMANVGEIH